MLLYTGLRMFAILWMNCHAKRLECVQLVHPTQGYGGQAAAVVRQRWLENGSKLRALQTLRADM